MNLFFRNDIVVVFPSPRAIIGRTLACCMNPVNGIQGSLLSVARPRSSWKQRIALVEPATCYLRILGHLTGRVVQASVITAA